MVIDIVGLEISIPTVIWTIINFFLLMFLLNKLLFKPVLKNMDERRKLVDDGLKIGHDAELKMAETTERLNSEITALHDEARVLIDESRSAAEKQKIDTIKNAREQAVDIRRDISTRISKEETEAQHTVEENMSEFVCKLANKLLLKEDSIDMSLVNEYLSDVHEE